MACTMLADWRPLWIDDLDCVNQIADSIHTTLPERPEVFEEKLRLFPQGCRKLVAGRTIVGYGISHPWMLHSIPPLDAFLGRLPAASQCIYIHDVAVLPAARGHGAAAEYVGCIRRLARQMKIAALALVSVYGTDRLWSRLGFEVVHDASVEGQLLSYGQSAKYMICGS